MMPELKHLDVTDSAAAKIKEFMKKEGKSTSVLRIYVVA